MLPASYLLSPRWFHKVSACFSPIQDELSQLGIISGERVHDKSGLLRAELKTVALITFFFVQSNQLSCSSQHRILRTTSEETWDCGDWRDYDGYDRKVF